MENETMKDMTFSEHAEMVDTADDITPESALPDMGLTENDHQPDAKSGLEQPAIDDLVAAADEFNAAFNTALYELDSSRKMFIEHSIRIDELNASIKTVNSALNDEVNKGHRKEEEYSQEKGQLNQRIYDIESMRDHLQQQMNEQEGTLNTRAEEIIQLTSRIEELTPALEQRTAEAQRAQEEIGQLTSRIEELTSTLGQRTAEGQHAQEEISQLTSRVEELTAALEQRTAEGQRIQEEFVRDRGELTNKIDELKVQIDEASCQADAHNQETARLHTELQELNESLQSSEALLEQRSNELQSLHTAHKELGVHAEKLENLNHAMHESSISENSLHKKALDDKAREIDLLQTKLEAATESLHQSDPEETRVSENLQNALNDLESRLKETEAEREILNEKVKETADLEVEVAHLRSALLEAGDAGSQGSVETDALQNLQGQVAGLQAALASSEAGKEALGNQLRGHEELEQEVMKLREVVQHADGKLLEQAGTVAVDRNRFLLHLNNLLAVPGDNEVKQTIMYILLDNFIQIRDEIGIMYSEQVITEISEIIASHCDGDNVLSRFGDCTFAVLSTKENTDVTREKASAIRATIENHIFESAGQSLITTTSIGICSVRKSDTSAEEVMSRADLACEAVRTSGGNDVLVSSTVACETTNQGPNEEHKEIVSRILSEDRIQIYYQPISTLKDISGSYFEVLTRIVDENGDMILPGEFFSMVTNTGQSANIDRYVIENTMKMMSENTEQEMTLFIKLTKQSVADHELPIWIINMIKQYMVNPERLVFEIAESILQNNVKHVSALSKALNSIGCKIAIEHYRMAAQAQHLQHTHTDYLKIDRGLVESVSRKGDSLAKVTAIMDMARKNNYMTIAEGVESPASLAILWELGVNFAQGYFIQAPAKTLDYNFDNIMLDEDSENSNRATFIIE
jgi:diguanylate cyclase (GGDEF)-like protein